MALPIACDAKLVTEATGLVDIQLGNTNILLTETQKCNIPQWSSGWDIGSDNDCLVSSNYFASTQHGGTSQ